MHRVTPKGQPSVAFSSLALLSSLSPSGTTKEVSTLSGRATLTLSVPLQNGLCFFPDELPDVGSVRLAVTPSVPDPRDSQQPVYHVSCVQPSGPVRSPPSASGSTFVTGVR